MLRDWQKKKDHPIVLQTLVERLNINVTFWLAIMQINVNAGCKIDIIWNQIISRHKTALIKCLFSPLSAFNSQTTSLITLGVGRQLSATSTCFLTWWQLIAGVRQIMRFNLCVAIIAITTRACLHHYYYDICLFINSLFCSLTQYTIYYLNVPSNMHNESLEIQ